MDDNQRNSATLSVLSGPPALGMRHEGTEKKNTGVDDALRYFSLARERGVVSECSRLLHERSTEWKGQADVLSGVRLALGGSPWNAGRIFFMRARSGVENLGSRQIFSRK